MYVHIYIYVYVYIYLYTYTCVHLYTRTRKHLSATQVSMQSFRAVHEEGRSASRGQSGSHFARQVPRFSNSNNEHTRAGRAPLNHGHSSIKRLIHRRRQSFERSCTAQDHIAGMLPWISNLLVLRHRSRSKGTLAASRPLAHAVDAVCSLSMSSAMAVRNARVTGILVQRSSIEGT